MPCPYFVVKKLTTEDTKEILHKGHEGKFIYGMGKDRRKTPTGISVPH